MKIRVETKCALLALGMLWAKAGIAWDLKKDADGVKVYTQEVKGSNMREFKAVTTMHSTLAGLMAVLEDVESYPSWFAACKEAKVLKVVSDTERLHYFVNDAPFPISLRDMILRIQVTQDEKTKDVTIHLNDDKEFMPPAKGMVRVTHLKGYWEFKPVGKGDVEVTYRLHTEPGGSLPAWAVNVTIVDNPFKTVKSMREKVKDSKYQKAKYALLKEPDAS